jgi:hypothetical protein
LLRYGSLGEKMLKAGCPLAFATARVIADMGWLVNWWAPTMGAMATTLTVFAWIVGIALAGGVWYVIFLAVREPIRMWRCRERKDAALMGVGVFFGLLFLLAASRVVP